MSEDDDDQALFPQTRRLESNYSTNNRMEDESKFANRSSLHMKSRANCMEEQTQNLNTNRVVGRPDKECKNRALNQSLPSVPTRNTRHSAPMTIAQPLSHVDINRPLDSNENAFLEQTFEDFRCWQPRGQSSLPPMQSRLDTLSQLMRREQHELTELHKSQIQFEHDTFHTNLQIYNQVSQHDKSTTDLMKYSSYLEQFIDKKMQILFQLKNKVQAFSAHVKDHHDCQLKYQQATQLQRQEDEVSLLDQVHQIEEELFRPQSNQQPYYFNSLQRQSDQRIPTHHHNTRYSMNANMMRGNGSDVTYRPTHESLFNSPYGRGY